MSHLNFHQPSDEFLPDSPFSPLRAFLDISGFLSYFMTLSNGPTLGIEPTACCWFARDASAPDIGGQEENCRSWGVKG